LRIGVQAAAAYFLAIVNQDGTLNSANHPAPQGSVMTFYITGLGLTTPLSQDGSVSLPPLPVPVGQVFAYIDSNLVQPQFVAAAYGLVAGITQVNVRVPVATYASNLINAFIGGAFSQSYISK
jgi:uncharacterized protein (TIGR03437 family)